MRTEQYKFLRSAWRIAYFSSLSYVVDYSFQLVDIYWVAKIGPGAATAITIASSVFFLILALNEIVGVSTVPLFTQSIGSGDKEAAGRTILQSIIAKLLLGIAMAIVFAGFMIWVAPRYRIAPETHGYLMDYGLVIWISLILLPPYSSMMTALRSMGEESKTALISVVALVMNAAINPILIFGFGSWNGWGLAGAAWATVLAQTVATALAVRFLLTARQAIPIFHRRHLVWWPWLYKRLILIGLPIGGVMILYNLEQAGITAIAASFDTAASDGFGVGARIYGFLFMAVFGISVGVSVTVGHHIGRGQCQDVQSSVPAFIISSTLAICILSVVMFLAARPIITLFTTEPGAIPVGAEYLHFMSVEIAIMCSLYAINGAFEGAGRNIPVLAVAGVMYLGVELPIIIWFMNRPDFALRDVWTAIIIASATGLLLTGWLFARGAWQPDRDIEQTI